MIKNKKAFTLIELIVTIAVLGILVLLASPRFFGHTQNAELTKGFANAKSIEKASELYYMDHEDWPRLTDEPYTSEEIESYSERIFENTGHEVNLDPEGNYYDIDYDKLSDYIQVPDDKKNYILQNPLGKVFYMENLNEAGKSRVDYNQVIKNDEEQEDTFEFTATFTNAGSTGRTGPSQSQLDRAYKSTELAGQVISQNGIQLWTVPETGTYRIETYGAQGGNGAGNIGGSGAIMKGQFTLTKGDQLKILVGQAGANRSETNVNSTGAGGGGTFVVSYANTPLIVAGAGGGAGHTQNGLSGSTGLNGTSSGKMSGAGGINGGGGGAGRDGSAGTQTSVGGNGSSCSYGAGGGGFYTRGGYNCSGNAPLISGNSFLSGGLGGNADTESGGVEGGFGGGAGVGHRASAGGGWSGGGGDGEYGGGGGGGSYSSGTNQENSVGNTGHGKVIITYIGK